MAGEGFFDFRERVTARNGRKSPASPQGQPTASTVRGPHLDAALTVSQLTAQIERALKAGFPGTVYVRGEVSNLNLHRSSGHLYFTLKDPAACIDCVMFRSEAAKLKFIPTDGIELLVGGRVAVYGQRGRYQLYATSLYPLGRGELELAFQQLCEKLKMEGLFEAERKKPLPRYPTRIALVTSRSTAALQDMLKVLRRFTWVKLYLYHVPVQGDGSAEMIADALQHLGAGSDSVGGVDLIVLSRGGGSLEDLWEFNEEIVARAIAASRIPVVTGIGHEVDVSIADLVADYHAHTPTEAAQVVTAHWKAVADAIDQAGARLRRGALFAVQDSRQRLSGIERHEFFRRPTHRIDQLRQFLDDRQRSFQLAVGEQLRAATARVARFEALLIECHPRHIIDLKRQKLQAVTSRLALGMRHELGQREQRIEALQRHLEAVSPQAVLNRGYTITTRKKDGVPLRAAHDARVGERLLTRFADGTVESTVEDQRQLPLFE